MARPIILMSERLCSVGWCERESYAKGLCRLHYVRTSRGTPLDQPVEDHCQGPIRFCSVAECDREHRAQGFCDAHYTRVSRDQSLNQPLGRIYGAG